MCYNIYVSHSDLHSHLFRSSAMEEQIPFLNPFNLKDCGTSVQNLIREYKNSVEAIDPKGFQEISHNIRLAYTHTIFDDNVENLAIVNMSKRSFYICVINVKENTRKDIRKDFPEIGEDWDMEEHSAAMTLFLMTFQQEYKANMAVFAM